MTLPENNFDVGVIGLGAMGAHTVQQLAARGVKVIGLERFGPLHDKGSSHGDSRLIRLGYFEGPAYVPLLRRAYQNWRMLEAKVREPLLTITGVLQLGRPDSKVVSGVLASSKVHNLPHELLHPAAVRSRYSAFQIDDDEVAVFEPEGGFLRPEQAIIAALKLAGADGAVLHFNERVIGIDPGDSGVLVVSDQGRYRVKKVIVAAGSYVGGLIPELRKHAVPIKQVVGWYQPRNGFVTALGRMPSFLRDDGDGGIYFGFPALGPDGVKVGKHGHFFEPIDPEKPNPAVNDADRAVLDGFMAKRLPAAAGNATGYITCRYTMLPGDDFLIDFLPGDRRIIVASPCSGHGFKFASVIGEILADLALSGETGLPIAPFSFAALEQRAANLSAPAG
jgi:sarcosine oxidase